MIRLMLGGIAIVLVSCLGWIVVMAPAGLLNQALAIAVDPGAATARAAPAPFLNETHGTLWRGRGHLHWPISDDNGVAADIRWQMDYRRLLSGRACFRIRLDGRSQPDTV